MLSYDNICYDYDYYDNDYHNVCDYYDYYAYDSYAIIMMSCNMIL